MENAIRLKEDLRNEIASNPEFQLKLATACNKSQNTIYRWCRQNAEELTMLSVMNAIRAYKGLSKDARITETISLTAAA